MHLQNESFQPFPHSFSTSRQYVHPAYAGRRDPNVKFLRVRRNSCPKSARGSLRALFLFRKNKPKEESQTARLLRILATTPPPQGPTPTARARGRFLESAFGAPA